MDRCTRCRDWQCRRADGAYCTRSITLGLYQRMPHCWTHLLVALQIFITFALVHYLLVSKLQLVDGIWVCVAIA